ncbi:MGMT family protein [Thalassobacillus hwangdonensis]|uniref:MGMT family protein n=1 Tax=Thalassobacillus hwangdonensis TaxID=546108 RepID=A0ABW3L2I9_9BACI
MKPFTSKVISIIQSIPEGYVMTYGQIAKEAGSPRAARQVVRILHSMSRKHALPWHRVINSKGEIAIKDEALNYDQMMMLEEEGVKFLSEKKVDLETCLYEPNKKA